MWHLLTDVHAVEESLFKYAYNVATTIPRKTLVRIPPFYWSFGVQDEINLRGPFVQLRFWNTTVHHLRTFPILCLSGVPRLLFYTPDNFWVLTTLCGSSNYETLSTNRSPRCQGRDAYP